MSIPIITLVELIPEFERYGISREGEVYDFKRKRFVSVYVDNKGYYRVNLCDKQGKHCKYGIHRLLAQVYIPNPEGLKCVDHKDRNTRNNSLDNLRWCTNTQNGMNVSIRTGNKSSRFKGVHLVKSDSKWVVQIRINGKKTHIGRFEEEEEAAIAYNRAAIEHFGQFANLNIL